MRAALLRIRFVVVFAVTIRCLSRRYDAGAVTALDETHGQKHIPDKPRDKHPVFGILVQIETINGIGIVKNEPRKVERHVMIASVPLGLGIVPLELIVSHNTGCP